MATDEQEIRLRAAGAADAAELAALRYRFRSELGRTVESVEDFAARAAPWLADRLGRGTWRAWVAVDAGGAIVGHLFAQLIEKIPNPVEEAETIVYITNAYVVPEQRGGGIGARLLEAALRDCRTPEVDRIILWPSRRSVTLYRRHGFAPPATLLELMNDQRPTTNDH